MNGLPTTMKAVAFTGVQQAALVDRACDAAPLNPNELAGRTLVSLISPGTELNFAYLGLHATYAHMQYPVFPGYAAVLEVQQVGSAIKDLQPGAMVFCMGGHAAWHRTIREQVIPVPEGLAPEAAVFARLMGVSWSTLITTTARPPDRVLVTGLGPVGNLAAQIFQTAGYRVTAVDPVEARRALALQVGLRDVRSATPVEDPALAGTIALAVECSGHEQAALAACRVVRKRGEVALVGVPWHKRTDLPAFDLLHAVFHRYVVLRSGWEWEVPFHPRDFVVGSISANLTAALEWLREGRVRVAGLYACRSPAECQAAYQDLLHQRGPPAVVFDWRGV